MRAILRESAHAGASIDAGSVIDHRSCDVQSESLPLYGRTIVAVCSSIGFHVGSFSTNGPTPEIAVRRLHEASEPTQAPPAMLRAILWGLVGS